MDALLQKGTLVDVTLAAEGKSIQVHRLVLCACSNYFQVLFVSGDFARLELTCLLIDSGIAVSSLGQTSCGISQRC